jgi:hypothetical protein
MPLTTAQMRGVTGLTCRYRKLRIYRCQRPADTGVIYIRAVADIKVDTAKTFSTLAIGDRVIFRGAKANACGIVTQVLDDGVVRVLWDSEERSLLQFGEVLVKRMPELRRAIG